MFSSYGMFHEYQISTLVVVGDFGWPPLEHEKGITKFNNLFRQSNIFNFFLSQSNISQPNTQGSVHWPKNYSSYQNILTNRCAKRDFQRSIKQFLLTNIYLFSYCWRITTSHNYTTFRFSILYNKAKKTQKLIYRNEHRESPFKSKTILSHLFHFKCVIPKEVSAHVVLKVLCSCCNVTYHRH